MRKKELFVFNVSYLPGVDYFTKPHLMSLLPKAGGVGRSARLEKANESVGESGREQRHVLGARHVGRHRDGDAVLRNGHERRGSAGYLPAGGFDREGALQDSLSEALAHDPL